MAAVHPDPLGSSRCVQREAWNGVLCQTPCQARASAATAGRPCTGSTDERRRWLLPVVDGLMFAWLGETAELQLGFFKKSIDNLKL